jgi:hypothetical protein
MPSRKLPELLFWSRNCNVTLHSSDHRHQDQNVGEEVGIIAVAVQVLGEDDSINY